MCEAASSVASPRPSAPAPLPFNLPTLSAEELHKMLLQTYRLGNRVRYKFILGLRAMDESGLFTKVGGTSIYAYASKHYHMSMTQTKEALRVAREISMLPKALAAFQAGQISWSHLMEMTRVAETATE